jgi:hypothetical protein
MIKWKKILIVIFAAIIFLILVAIVGWTAIPNKINENDSFIINEDAKGGRIALILDNSDYKNELARIIGSNLGLDIRTDGFGLEDITEINSSEYDAVVVMAPVYAGRLQTDAKKWIKSISASDNIILFVTSNGLTEISMPVDTVSSATPQMGETDTIPASLYDMADIIIEKIMTRINE